jgi:hypothetical protein
MYMKPNRAIVGIGLIACTAYLYSRCHKSESRASTQPSPQVSALTPMTHRSRPELPSHGSQPVDRGAPTHTTNPTRNLGGFRFPDKTLGVRTPVGKNFEKVVYTIDDYNKAYPDKRLGTRSTIFAEGAGGANVSELQGHGDEPLVTLPQVLVSCPPAVYNTLSGLSVYLDKDGKVQEAFSADGLSAAPPAVSDCQFHPFIVDGDPSDAVVTIPPRGVISEFNRRSATTGQPSQ